MELKHCCTGEDGFCEGREPAALLKLLDGEDDKCGNAAFALGKIGDASAIPALIRAAGKSGRDTRRDIAIALGKIKSVEAVPTLIGFLETNDGVLSRYAAWALGEIGDASAVPALVEAIERKNHLVRSSAAEALVKIGEFRPVFRLIYSERKKVQMSAYKAVSAMIGSASMEWIKDFLVNWNRLASRRGDGETSVMLRKLRRKAAAREEELRLFS